ncbi:cryptochrome/photolyase family protein [Pseudoalteromonas tunicata]|uniref:cryptochrome/photolyase family protein n=1 Tax=Pseudoalteromonas tunicata TaxID=314281 RepID=UPI00273F7A77|nr:cryptochrome/photolyase family protein [Pseudoalteromonas tunicata]MDP5214126.1 cryptochrome/photolyase family protein [Pseudoalteromonas tunicata]
MSASFSTLRFILGDQLNANHSWFKQNKDNILYVIAELRQETDYAPHHIQKVCGFFASMGQFANALKQAGFNVLHLTLDDTEHDANLPHLIARLCLQYQCKSIEYQQPDEYRLAQQLNEFDFTPITKVCVDSEHFMLPFNEISQYFKKDKHVTMEHFYRKMRKRFNLLMHENEPLGGQWNFDADNRVKLKKTDLAAIPAPLLFEIDVSDIKARLVRHHVKTIGQLTEPFIWPVNRTQAKELLAFFCQHLLPNFGRFQDAMTANSEHSWSLYHSRLSFAINCKMLHPLQVIQAAVSAYEQSDGLINLAQVEGFVRQILGWREYVRGVYWTNMPDYKTYNTLDAKRDLPGYFWHGKTKMSCLHHAISQSLNTAYAHHIQRLMVTGNFCLLTGIDPDQVDDWYLGIYIDAIEWVELPNTRGMTQFADNGIVATKPYAASGNYINKMSDYCTDCHYQVKDKVGDNACPLNSLYWQFMIQHRERLERNPRIGMIYRNWDKQSLQSQTETLNRAKWCLDNIEQL